MFLCLRRGWVRRCRLATDAGLGYPCRRALQAWSHSTLQAHGDRLGDDDVRVQILVGEHRGRLGLARKWTVNGLDRLRVMVHWSSSDLVYDEDEVRPVPNHGDEDGT